MRMIFGVLSLLVALAIVASVAKKQLQALSTTGVSTRISQMASAPQDGAAAGDRDGATLAIPGGMPGGVAADTSGLTVPQQAQNIEQQFKQSTERALQQGADRNARSMP
jgi:hypothetical protein